MNTARRHAQYCRLYSSLGNAGIDAAEVDRADKQGSARRSHEGHELTFSACRRLLH